MRFIIKRLFSFTIASIIKVLCHLLFSLEARWLHTPPKEPFKDIRLFILLNHTSLYEPLFLGVFPYHFLWWASKRCVMPAADKTMNRPIVGLFYKMLAPKTVTITRKRDDTWNKFVQEALKDSFIIIMPEGRMKRPNGLDAYGKPMSVRAGVADLLAATDNGQILIGYSGGLHHIQAPGQLVPRIFKKIRINLELTSVQDYKKSLKKESHKDFTGAVIADLEARMKVHTPKK